MITCDDQNCRECEDRRRQERQQRSDRVYGRVSWVLTVLALALMAGLTVRMVVS